MIKDFKEYISSSLNEKMEERLFEIKKEISHSIISNVELDELKISTLGSYIKKASVDSDKQHKIATDANKKMEKLDNGDSDWLDVKDKWDNQYDIRKKAFKTAQRRTLGIETATHKIVSAIRKEDVDSIDELHAYTLGSYIRGADWSRSHQNDIIKYAKENERDAIRLGYPEKVEKAKKNIETAKRRKTNRFSGISTAVDKLVKGDYQK